MQGRLIGSAVCGANGQVDFHRLCPCCVGGQALYLCVCSVFFWTLLLPAGRLAIGLVVACDCPSQTSLLLARNFDVARANMGQTLSRPGEPYDGQS